MRYGHILLLAWCMIFVNSITLSKLEGHLLPVVKDTVVTRTVNINGDLEFWGTFQKVRACSFRSVRLKVHSDSDYDLSTLATITIKESVKVRKEGAQEFGPWSAKVTDNQMQNASLVLEHDCPLPFIGSHRVVTTDKIEIKTDL